MAERISAWIAGDPLIFIGGFVAVTVFALFLMISTSVRKKSAKKKLLSENGNLAELEFDYVVTPLSPIGGMVGHTGYILYTVNGKPPQIFGRSVLVPGGEAEVECEYFVLTVGNRFATSMGRGTQRISVTAGKRYSVSYNLIEGVLEVKMVK